MINRRKALMSELIVKGIDDLRVVDALVEVPREFFVLDEFKHLAYEDISLPILEGQTISQPFTVARMLELLNVREGDLVLEVGAGSGYNAALIKCLVGRKRIVYSIEINEVLCDFAKRNLERAKIGGVRIICGDGYGGYEKIAPFDRIIISAAVSRVPSNFFEQLSENGGILVAPVREGYGSQIMTKFVKRGSEVSKSEHGSFVFVPMIGEILKEE